MGSFHSRPTLPGTPNSRGGSPTRRFSSPQPSAPRYYLALDVHTTTEDKPQLVSIEAAIYVLENEGEGGSSCLRKLGEMEAVAKPRLGYAVLRHMQDVRYHGVTAETMASKGEEASAVVKRLVDMIADATGTSIADVDGPSVMVIAHGAMGMLSNLSAVARVDETLHPYWEELEALCQQSDDTLPMAVKEHPIRWNHSLEYTLAASGLYLPENRARAVAKLYCFLKGWAIGEHPEWASP